MQFVLQPLTYMNEEDKKNQPNEILHEAANEEYKYGFVTDIETAVIPKGLN